MMERRAILLVINIYFSLIYCDEWTNSSIITDTDLLNLQKFICESETSSSELIINSPDAGKRNLIPKEQICWVKSTTYIKLISCKTLTERKHADLTCLSNYRKNSFCPDHLIEINLSNKNYKLCLKVSISSESFQDRFCYGSDTLISSLGKEELELIKWYLESKNISNFWIPIKRNYPYDPFTVRLPGNNWGRLFNDIQLSAEELSSRKQCAIASINRDYKLEYKTVNCDYSSAYICVFKRHFVTISGCPQGFAAMAYQPHHCFGVEWQSGLFPFDLQPVTIAEYNSKRNEIQFIFRHTDIAYKSYFMVEKVMIGGKEYAIEMNRDENFHLVSYINQKPALSKEIVKNRKNVILTLRANTDRDELFLTVYNRNYIWRIGDDDNDDFGLRCFVDASMKIKWRQIDVDLIWQNELQTKTIFKLNLKNDNPGYYWCEAHTIFDFSLVYSTKIFGNYKGKKEHTFAAEITVPCAIDICTDIYGKKTSLSDRTKLMLKTKQSQHISGEQKVLKIHDVEPMIILNISKKFHTLKCLFHITTSLKNSTNDNSFEVSSDEKDDFENPQKIRYNIVIQMRLRDLLISLLSTLDLNSAKSVKSTKFCFPETVRTRGNQVSQWNLARFGQITTTSQLCLQENGLPITRTCLGNFIVGASWDRIKDVFCTTINDISNITRDLHEYNKLRYFENAPINVIANVQKIVEENVKIMIPVDFYYTAQLMRSSISNLLQANKSFEYLKENKEKGKFIQNIIRIYNKLFEADEEALKLSATMNATNILLDTFESTIDKISLMPHPATSSNLPINDVDNDVIKYSDIGVDVHITSNLIVFIIEPEIANITGVAFFKISEEQFNIDVDIGTLHGKFKNEIYKFILANQTTEELMYEKNLQLASYVPSSLWQRLDEIWKITNSTIASSKKKIIFKIYSNDILFQRINRIVEEKVSGRVISITIPGHARDLPEMLPIIFRGTGISDSNASDENCRYWNYETWAEDGITYLGRSNIENDLILCGCMHVTPFAYLIGGAYKLSVDSKVVIITEVHDTALDYITLVGCSLSLFGILCIKITALAFKSWRKKASSKILLQLSVAIALQMILFCFVNTHEYSSHLIQNKIYGSCIVIGACLHYSVLAQFCWMLVIAYLQFKRYVQVFGNVRPTRFFIKSSAFGWGVPAIPVAIILLYDHKTYIPEEISARNAICYPSGYCLYFGVVLPITMIIVANLIIFISVIYNILKTPEGSIRQNERQLIISQVRLSILLFFLLGFTWIFGLLTVMRAGLLFSYLFSLTATLQGFVIFIYFIVLDPVTRRMWRTNFARIFGISINLENISSVKEIS